MAAAFTEVLGEPVAYQSIPFDVYRKLGFPGADDLGNMFQFYHDFEADFCGRRDLAFARQLNPELQDFKTWLRANRGAIKIQ